MKKQKRTKKNDEIFAPILAKLNKYITQRQNKKIKISGLPLSTPSKILEENITKSKRAINFCLNLQVNKKND